MNKTTKTVIFAICVLLVLATLVGCATKTYKVTFYNGSTVVTTQTVNANESAKKPADPTKEGYTFSGWFTDSALTKEYKFTEKVTADLKLYAKFVEKTPPPAETK